MKNEGFRRGDVFMAELRAWPPSGRHSAYQHWKFLRSHADCCADYVLVKETRLPSDTVPSAAITLSAGREHRPLGANHDD